MGKRTITILENQSIFDIALREYGSIEGIFLLLNDNPTLNGLDAPLDPGSLLFIESAPLDREIAEHYQRNELYPVTGWLFVPDACLLYPCVPASIVADFTTAPALQGSLESGGAVAGKRYLVVDLDQWETEPQITTLFARNTGNILTFRGVGDTGGVEGSAWDREVVPINKVVEISTTRWKVHQASNGAVLYPTSKFALKFLQAPEYNGAFEQVSLVSFVNVNVGYFSPCRFRQVQKATFMAPTTWVDFGARLAENAPNGLQLDNSALYRMKWTTGPANNQCLQGYSQTIFIP